MSAEELPCIGVELQKLTDAELASLIIEFAGADEAALALGEEIYRRLTTLRLKQPASPTVFSVRVISN